jgi:hypothetical protein
LRSTEEVIRTSEVGAGLVFTVVVIIWGRTDTMAELVADPKVLLQVIVYVLSVVNDPV